MATVRVGIKPFITLLLLYYIYLLIYIYIYKIVIYIVTGLIKIFETKLRWRCARDLFESQILVNIGGFGLQISRYEVVTLLPSGLRNHFVCKRFAVQTLLRSHKFVIQINLEHDTTSVWGLARSWSTSTLLKLFLLKNWKL